MIKGHPVGASLGRYRAAVEAALQDMENTRIPARLWAQDHTVWKSEPTEISNRLGWLHTAEVMEQELHELREFAAEVRAAGFTGVVLLGMGGSSLAPEVFTNTFGPAPGYPALGVLDSTVPGVVLEVTARCDPAHTLFIVSTKSGTTVETLSLFRFFYNWVAQAVGVEAAGSHFSAITDPGSPLTALAGRYRFRRTFLNDRTIGGRYSALSYFGLVPASLIGVDLNSLLRRAQLAAAECKAESPIEANPGFRLGAILGELAKAGRDKLTLVISPELASFGAWVEQLIAESTGKEGRGILPVVGEPLGRPEAYGQDRLFASLRLEGDHRQEPAMEALEAAGHPVVRILAHDRYDLGQQFFVWEVAAAVAAHLLGINPFDQPDVDRSKRLADRLVTDYQRTGALAAERPSLTGDGISFYGAVPVKRLPEVVPAFLGRAASGAYVAYQAYLRPTPETDSALAELRVRTRDRFRLATTVGYGPRFLHSTGQLHKGDAGRGLFIQLTADDPQDAPIPNEAGAPQSSITFGVLKNAQAQGDLQALEAAGRRVIRFHLGQEAAAGIGRLSDWLR